MTHVFIAEIRHLIEQWEIQSNIIFDFLLQHFIIAVHYPMIFVHAGTRLSYDCCCYYYSQNSNCGSYCYYCHSSNSTHAGTASSIRISICSIDFIPAAAASAAYYVKAITTIANGITNWDWNTKVISKRTKQYSLVCAYLYSQNA